GGSFLGGENAVRGLCEHGEEIIRFLESIGTVFSVDSENRPSKRAFGGQSHKRTYYCGSSTGKQIVSALVMEARRFEATGMITRRLKYSSCMHLLRNEEVRRLLFYKKNGILSSKKDQWMAVGYSVAVPSAG
ncbi:MAG: FAD-binding protein, partial [Lachnospiraceae bacterium]|nr:FAD-binding protein [Lachnospiraceae bacterium]